MEIDVKKLHDIAGRVIDVLGEDEMLSELIDQFTRELLGRDIDASGEDKEWEETEQAVLIGVIEGALVIYKEIA